MIPVLKSEMLKWLKDNPNKTILVRKSVDVEKMETKGELRIVAIEPFAYVVSAP